MIVLAIDTAGIDCSAAVFDSSAGRLLSAVSEEIGKGHAVLLEHGFQKALCVVSFATFAATGEGQKLKHPLACFVVGHFYSRGRPRHSGG